MSSRGGIYSFKQLQSLMYSQQQKQIELDYQVIEEPAYQQIVKILTYHAQKFVEAKKQVELLKKQFKKGQLLIIKTYDLTLLINFEDKLANGSFGSIILGFILFKNQPKIIKAAVKQNILTEQKYKKQGYIISYNRQIQIFEIIKLSEKKCQNIVKYYMSFKRNEKAYAVIQYIDNMQIKTLIQSKTLTETQIYDIIYQLVRAIYFLQIQVFTNNDKIHWRKKKQVMSCIQTMRDQRKYKQQFKKQIQNIIENLGIIHRDLKPDNILIQKKNGKYYLKLCDFGVSKIANVKEKQCYTVCGTKIYCPPQDQNKAYSGKFDVWGIGIIVLQIICPKFRQLLANKKFDLKGNQQAYFSQVNKIQKQYDFLHWKYKLLWSKLLNNCLKQDQNERWDIASLQKFMRVNKKRVDNNGADGDQQEPADNIKALGDMVNQYRCIYLQTLKHQRGLRTRRPQYNKRNSYHAVLNLYFFQLNERQKGIKQLYKIGTSKFAPQNEYLQTLDQMIQKLNIVIRPYLNQFQKEAIKDQTDKIFRKTDKFQKNRQQLHRCINVYLK